MTTRIKHQSDDTAEKEFHRAMQAIVRVPKAEVEEQEQKKREAKVRKQKKDRA